MWNTTGDRSDKLRYESLSRSTYGLRLILIYLGRSWYSVHFTGAKYSWLTYGFSHVLLRGFGALIGLIPQANFSGLCNSLTLHVAAMTGKCLSRLLQLELKHHIGDGKIRKKFWGTSKHPNPGRLGNSLYIYIYITLDLRCICVKKNCFLLGISQPNSATSRPQHLQSGQRS